MASAAATSASSPPEPALTPLFLRAGACFACPDMWHTHVLGPANGPVPARIMLVGEAPGRLGAGRTGVPFRGDEAGRRFDALLILAGLARGEVFVTNAVLCNPLSGRGLNRRPRPPEVLRCSGFLREQVLAVDPAVVVAMGGVALGALGRVVEHGLSLRDGCGGLRPWFGRQLIAVYHPGRRSTVHRPDLTQRQDWARLGGMLRETPLFDLPGVKS